jgi:hypothetical protein
LQRGIGKLLFCEASGCLSFTRQNQSRQKLAVTSSDKKISSLDLMPFIGCFGRVQDERLKTAVAIQAMTATRNASLAPQKYLIEHGIDVFAVTKEKPPEPYPLSYDKEELRIYAVILAASAAPAFLLWSCRASIT